MNGAQTTLAKFHPRMSIALENLPDDQYVVPPLVHKAWAGYRQECGRCTLAPMGLFGRTLCSSISANQTSSTLSVDASPHPTKPLSYWHCDLGPAPSRSRIPASQARHRKTERTSKRTHDSSPSRRRKYRPAGLLRPRTENPYRLPVATRGEGGQNLIGSEQGDLLGVIRTQELLAARRIDGAQQFFTPRDRFRLHQNAGGDAGQMGTRVAFSPTWSGPFGTIQPDVIILRFSGTPRDGHGQHQASAMLGKEAFSAAADPNRFPGAVNCGLEG